MRRIFETPIKIAEAPNLMSYVQSTINFLKGKKTLIMSFSNRWAAPGKEREKSKSELIGRKIAEKLGANATFINAAELKIYGCEANISRADGNNCGVPDARLKDEGKNPSGNHRCWASINNKDDELWKISKPLLKSESVLFIAPVRWGQACANYQRVIERLSWIENRRTTLEDRNIVETINAGFICIGHNWNAENVANTQKKVLGFFGFKTPSELTWSYQWTKDQNDESAEGYQKEAKAFEKSVKLTINNRDVD